MIICSMPLCQTAAGCVCRPVFKSLSGFTDEEIAREYFWRAQKKLGDPRIGVSFPITPVVQTGKLG
jgi:hypothetical protein